MSEEKELNTSKLVQDIMAAIPQVMACIKCPENQALAATVSAILDDLRSNTNPTKLGDGKILAMLAKLLPVILQLLPLFMTPKV